MLTDAQRAIVREFVTNTPEARALAGRLDALAAWLNEPIATRWIWRDRVAVLDIAAAGYLPDVTVSARLDSLRAALLQLVTIDARDPRFRDGVLAAWKGDAEAPALAACMRRASRIESLLATGDGVSPADPAVPTFVGPVAWTDLVESVPAKRVPAETRRWAVERTKGRTKVWFDRATRETSKADVVIDHIATDEELLALRETKAEEARRG